MKTILLCLVSLITFNSYSQIAPAVQWQNSIGGSMSDMMWSLCISNNGGYVLAGRSVSDISGDKSENSLGQSDFWVVRTDSAGNIVAQNTIGGSESEYLESVAPTNDGGFILGGYSDSDISGDKSENSQGYLDYWIVKVDSILNIQWQNTIGGNGLEYLGTIKQTYDGGYIFGGYSNSNLSGDKTEDTIGGFDYWIVKTDSLGVIEWDNTIGGSGDEYIYDLIQTSDHGYMLGGRSESDSSGDKTENSNGDSDYWIVKTDSLGNILWQNTIGSSGPDILACIIQTFDGGYALGGYSWSGISGDKTEAGHGGMDYWVVKTDSNGLIQWQNTIGGNAEDGLSSLIQTSDSGFVFGGFSSSPISGEITEASSGRDYFIVKTDPQLNIIWQNTFNADCEDWIREIKQTSDGYILGGYSCSNISGDKTENCVGWYDYWLVKLTDNFNTISGRLFIDINSNGIFDPGEVILNAKKITESITGRYSFSVVDGSYHVEVLDTGNYSVSPATVNYYTAVPSVQNVNFAGMHLIDSLNDFAFQPISSINDLCITITQYGPFRPGFNASYMINYENIGTTTLSPTIVLFPDTGLTYVSSSIAASGVTTDSIFWNLGNLLPYYSGSMIVTLNVDTSISIGSLLQSYCRIDPVVSDTNPTCNFSTCYVIATASFDPNKIVTDHEFILQPDLLNPPFIEYIIYFQNTGSDTAFNVSILDPIDPTKLDVSTLELVTSSFPANMQYNSWERNIKFSFNDILLVDSNINEPGSHGFVRFKIKPFSNLVTGDTIFNRAYIYFDFNNPVTTNRVATAIIFPVSTFEISESEKIILYPNPVTSELTIGMPAGPTAIHLKIFDLLGQQVYTGNLIGKNETIEVNINLDYLNEGVYVVSIEGADKNWFAKFVKK